MKFFIKALFAVVLLLAVILPMFIKGPNGQPIMSVGDWMPATDVVGDLIDAGAEKVDNTLGANNGSEQPAGPPSLARGQMYKWQDQQGRWHFSNEMPGDAVQVSVEELPEVENVMEPPVKEQDNSSTISLPGGFSL